jgi:hypothetical protein
MDPIAETAKAVTDELFSLVPKLLIEYDAAGSMDDKRQYVHAHPELLSDGALLVLLLLMDEAGRKGSDVSGMWAHHSLLRRCREIGIDPAFAEAVTGRLSVPPLPPQYTSRSG